MTPLDIDATLTPSADDVAAVKEGMRAFELSLLPGLPDESEDVTFYAFARDPQNGARPIGGVIANVFWDGVEIDTLWVADEHRHRRIGSRLLDAAESFGRERGAVVAYVKTVAARGFYERNGYSVFGVLEDRPLGTELFHLKKRIDGA